MADSNPDDEREEIQRQLEWLRRRRRITLHPSTFILAIMMVRNVNSFPLKLRSVISETNARWPACMCFGEDIQFNNVVYNAFWDFFCGRPIPEDYIDRYSSNDYKDWKQYTNASSTVNTWCGLDSCNTLKEAELAIRVFPWERLKFPTGHLEAMSKHSQTVSFIPIFMEIYMERHETYYLYNSFDAVVKGCWYLMAPETVRGETFDRKCLTVLDEIFTRSPNNGLVRSTVMKNFLAAGPIHPIYNERIFVTTFIEETLRFFTDRWYQHYRHLRDSGLTSVKYLNSFGEATADIIFHLGGISYYPNELGFVFHKELYPKLLEKYENQEIQTMIEKQVLVLSQKWGKSRTAVLHRLIVNAATHDEISVDGVYSLLRFDPGAIFTCHRSSSSDGSNVSN